MPGMTPIESLRGRAARALRRPMLVAAAAAALLAGCASTTLQDQWGDPGFNQGPFRKWLVVSVGGGPAATRTFEDIMSSHLQARGVEASAGWRYLPERQATESELDSAVAASGADGLMMVHLRRVETRTQVTQVAVPMGGPGFGWWGAYGGWWGTVPEVRQYDIAVVETMVYAVKGRRLVWSGVTQTFDPSSVAREAPGFSEVILEALAQRNLVPPKKS